MLRVGQGSREHKGTGSRLGDNVQLLGDYNRPEYDHSLIRRCYSPSLVEYILGQPRLK